MLFGVSIADSQWDGFVSDESRRWLQGKPPIGCQTTTLTEKLQAAGFKAYRSGPATFLSPRTVSRRDKRLLLIDVDIPPEVIPESLETRREATAGWDSRLSYSQRLQRSDSLRVACGQASLVVTSSLVVALVARAHETPVVLVREDGETDPLSEYATRCQQVLTKEQAASGYIDWRLASSPSPLRHSTRAIRDASEAALQEWLHAT